jgi:hypothetical protein
METLFTINYIAPAKVGDAVVMTQGKHKGRKGRVLRSYFFASAKGAGMHLAIKVNRVRYTCTHDYVEVQA